MKNKKTEWFAMRLDRDTRKRLEMLSDKSGLSQSHVLRLLINNTSNLKIGLVENETPTKTA